jgi:hypothetical protein
MKAKLLFIILSLLLLLTGCGEVDPDQIRFELNPGIDTVEVNDVFIDAGVKASYFGLPIQVEIIENTVDMSTIGQYQITYQIDYRGIIKTLTRVVFVVDETAPIGTLNPGIDTIVIGGSWIDASIAATDNSNETVTITTTGFVNPNFIGSYMITYTLTDTSGNQSIYYRWVYVIENVN